MSPSRRLASVVLAAALAGCGGTEHTGPKVLNPYLPEGVRPPLPGLPPEEAAASRSRPLAPVLFLEPTQDRDTGLHQFGGGHSSGLLERELGRQALLIAARDGLGLTTRDGTLREPPPDGLPPDNRLYAIHIYRLNHPAHFTVQRGEGEGRRLVWKHEFDQVRWPTPALLQTTENAEKLSRGGYVEALKRAGFDGTPNREAADAAVPEEVEALLGEMTFVAQFDAARRLHAALRTGESRQLVGALVRAYAHLGMLTEWQWSPQHKVFKARALLYAQRLVVREPTSPWGQWHRAYAAASAGLHKDALDDLDRAGAAAGAAPPPPWVDLIRALCRFDHRALEAAAAKDPKQAGLARFFRFVTVEGGDNVQMTLAHGRDVLAECPDCLRVVDLLSDIGGGSQRDRATQLGFELLEKALPRRLSAVPGLPPEVAGLLKKAAPESEVFGALLAARDAGEPSWAALGRWGQEARFLLVTRVLKTARLVWDASVGDYVREVLPLIADHPYKNFVASYGFDRQRNPRETQRLFQEMRLTDLEPTATEFVYALRTLPGRFGTDAAGRANGNDDPCYHGYGATLRAYAGQDTDTSPLAERLLAVSPHAPLARAHLVKHAWPAVEKHAAAWEKDDQPHVLRELGQRYTELKRFADAERLLKRAAELSPGLGVSRALADVYRAQGRLDLWEEVWESFLGKDEDGGLESARARVDLARGLMGRGAWERAKPHALTAAETWAGWAMLCAADCCEGLKEWDTAELWARRTSERYETSRPVWLFWCHRTGKGDRAAALAHLEKHVNGLGGQLTENDRICLTAYHWLSGRPRAAALALEPLNNDTKVAWAPLLHALLLAEADDVAGRDAALYWVPDANLYSPLAALFRKALKAGGRLDREAADAFVKTLPPADDEIACFFVGHFLDLQGQTKEAIPYLERCLAFDASKNRLFPAVAGARLRELVR